MLRLLQACARLEACACPEACACQEAYPRLATSQSGLEVRKNVVHGGSSKRQEQRAASVLQHGWVECLGQHRAAGDGNAGRDAVTRDRARRDSDGVARRRERNGREERLVAPLGRKHERKRGQHDARRVACAECVDHLLRLLLLLVLLGRRALRVLDRADAKVDEQRRSNEVIDGDLGEDGVGRHQLVQHVQHLAQQHRDDGHDGERAKRPKEDKRLWLARREQQRDKEGLVADF
mmetsp:Transcript_14131/g.41043  ORF Transcript_14131/g.41043 Transcript_14131/m.41043 type:complete len:235 (+) Transcript_14131:799-1503(+)